MLQVSTLAASTRLAAPANVASSAGLGGFSLDLAPAEASADPAVAGLPPAPVAVADRQLFADSGNALPLELQPVPEAAPSTEALTPAAVPPSSPARAPVAQPAIAAPVVQTPVATPVVQAPFDTRVAQATAVLTDPVAVPVRRDAVAIAAADAIPVAPRATPSLPTDLAPVPSPGRKMAPSERGEDTVKTTDSDPDRDRDIDPSAAVVVQPLVVVAPLPAAIPAASAAPAASSIESPTPATPAIAAAVPQAVGDRLPSRAAPASDDSVAALEPRPDSLVPTPPADAAPGKMVLASAPAPAPAAIAAAVATLVPGDSIAVAHPEVPVATTITPATAAPRVAVAAPPPAPDAPERAASAPPAPPAPDGEPAPLIGVAQPAGRAFAAAIAAAARPARQIRQATSVDDAPRALPTALADVQRVATAAVTGADQAPLDTRREDWPTRLIERIETLRDAADAGDTRIRLVPAGLGKIDVALRQQGDTLHVHFTADVAATRALLSEAQPRLAELAQERGLRLGQSGVDGGSQGAGQDQRRAPEAQQPRRPASAVSASQGAETDSDQRIA